MPLKSCYCERIQLYCTIWQCIESDCAGKCNAASAERAQNLCVYKKMYILLLFNPHLCFLSKVWSLLLLEMSRFHWFWLPRLHVTPQQMNVFVSVSQMIFVLQVSERLAPVKTHLCIEFSLQTPQKCPPLSVTGPRCPPLCCNWEQLCAEVTIVHTERFLEEGPGCVQSTLYPHAECRQATVPTGRSIHRAASLNRYFTSKMPHAPFVLFYCTACRQLGGAESCDLQRWRVWG